jgi:hypothetical protein
MIILIFTITHSAYAVLLASSHSPLLVVCVIVTADEFLILLYTCDSSYDVGTNLDRSLWILDPIKLLVLILCFFEIPITKQHDCTCAPSSFMMHHKITFDDIEADGPADEGYVGVRLDVPQQSH